MTAIPRLTRDPKIGVNLHIPISIDALLSRLAADTGQTRSNIVAMLIKGAGEAQTASTEVN